MKRPVTDGRERPLAEREFDLILADNLALYLERLGREAMEETPEGERMELPRETRRYLAAVTEQRRRRQRTRARRQWLVKQGRRAAVLFFIGAFSLMVAYAKVSAFRIFVNNWVAEVVEEFTRVQTWSERAVPAFDDRTSVRYPEFVPKGFELVFAEDVDNIVTMRFENMSGQWYLFKQGHKNSTNYHLVGIEDVMDIKINDLEGQYSTKDSYSCVTWHDDTTVYYISGNISLEQMIQIAESVR